MGRHYGHRQDCKAGVGGVDEQVHPHHAGSMDHLVGSVEPGNHPLLDRKIHRLKTMEQWNIYMGVGAMYLRDELKRNSRFYYFFLFQDDVANT